MVRLTPFLSDEENQFHELVIQRWNSSGKTFEYTRNVVVSLQHLGTDFSRFLESIRTDWLPLAESDAVSLDPKTRIEDILYMVEIESILYPHDFRSRACIAQLASILEVTFGAQKGSASMKN